MKKGVEILVLEKDSGLIKHRVRETFEFKDGVLSTPEQQKRFEDFGRGFLRLIRRDSNNVIQISCEDLPDYVQKGIFIPVSNKRCQYVHPHEMG